MDDLADEAAVGAGVVDAASIDLALPYFPEICEPESAAAIEDDVVRSLERPSVAGIVEHLDRPGVEVHPLDAAAHVVVRLPDRAAVAVLFHLPLESAVVADVALAIRTDGRSVGTAAGLGHDLLPTIGKHPGEGAAGDLDQEHGAVRHRDRSFGKEEAVGDGAVLHRLRLLQGYGGRAGAGGRPQTRDDGPIGATLRGARRQ